MATASPATPKLGKRRASNMLIDLRPARKGCRCVVGKLDNNGEDGDGDDSEAECEEVWRCLLQLVTPSPVGRPTLATLIVTSLSHVSMPLAPPTSRSPLPTPQPMQRKCKHTASDTLRGPVAPSHLKAGRAISGAQEGSPSERSPQTRVAYTRWSTAPQRQQRQRSTAGPRPAR
jgi:hypothetical protein